MGKVAIAHYTAPTSTGTFNITTTDLGGSTPNAAYFITTRHDNATLTEKPDLTCGIGATDGTNQWAISIGDENAESVVSDTRTIGYDSACNLSTFAAGGVDYIASFDSWITDGITLNCTNAASLAWNCIAVFILADNVHCNKFTINASENGTTTVTDPGFTPDAGLMISCADLDGTSVNNARLALGAFSNDGAETQRVCMIVFRDGRSTSESNGRYSESYCGGGLFTGGSYDFTVEITSFTASGFVATTRLGTPPAGTDEAGYLCWEGGLDTHLATYTTPTSTGNDTLPTAGFTPDLRLFGVTTIDSVDTSETTGDGGVIGHLVISPDASGSIVAESEDAQSTTDTGVRWSDASGTPEMRIGFDDHSTAFDINYVDTDTLDFDVTDTGAARNWWCLSLAGTAAPAASAAILTTNKGWW